MLRPACERIEIAGSIRRLKPEVKDIEIVAVPKMGAVPVAIEQPQLGGPLFGDRLVNRLDESVGAWLDSGYAQPRLDKNGHRAIGAAYKRLEVSGRNRGWIALDLFSVLGDAQWGLIFMIRTGSGVGPSGTPIDGFGPAMLARWKQVSGGGYSLGGCLRERDGTPVSTPEEEDVFRVCRAVWMPPEERIAASAVQGAGG